MLNNNDFKALLASAVSQPNDKTRYDLKQGMQQYIPNMC